MSLYRTVGTVTAQLLYEVGGPEYLNPDASARFDSIRLQQVGRDRVLVDGIVGLAPPERLKVAMNYLGGFRNSLSLVITGMVKYTDVKIDAPLAEAFRSVGKPGFATMISVGALIGLTTVMMILMLGQSRVFFAMSRDRLLPPVFSIVNERTGAPVRTTITTGVAVAVISTFVPLSELAELVNIGTLFAFILVAVGVLVLRRKRPDLERAFRCPGVPVVPLLAMLTSFYLMLNLPAATWVRFVVWMVIGFAIYFLYGARRSRLATDPNYSLAADAAARGARED